MRSPGFLLVFALLAAGLVGCGHADNVLIAEPDVAVEPENRVDMLVATTRADTNALPGQMFTGEREQHVSYAEISVSIPRVRQVGDIQWPASLPANPQTDFVTLETERYDLKTVIKRFDRRLSRKPHGRALIFIHGFNTRFEEAVYRFAQIMHDSQVPAVPVLFTWPSRGALFAYGYDRESANYSRDALETLIQSLVDDKNVREIAILAHSMGNMTTLEALRQMTIRNGGLSPKIKDIMLAAPDVDIDVFRRQMAEIRRSKPSITLFSARNDEALAISRRLWGDKARLGSIDPNTEPYKSELARDKINVIDLTNVKSDDPIGHSRFASSPIVVETIGRRLASGQSLTAPPGVGDVLGDVALGAANAGGTAAHLALSAPFSAYDARSRETFSNNVDKLGSHLSDTGHSALKAAPGTKELTRRD